MNDRVSEQLLRSLREIHRRLDADIELLRADAFGNAMDIARLKKRKLRLRDEITALADSMIPDLIA